jgi:hypothetical protein
VLSLVCCARESDEGGLTSEKYSDPSRAKVPLEGIDFLRKSVEHVRGLEHPD